MWIVLLTFGLAARLVNSAVLPSYLTACSISDPNFGKCAVDSANAAISHFIDGDKSIRLSTLKPRKIDLLDVEASDSLTIKLINIEVFGLGNIVFDEIDVNPVEKYWIVKAKSSQFQLIGSYNMNGRILILPISGNGFCNITMNGVEFEYRVDYELKKKNDENYANFVQSSVKYDVQRVYYRFDNLFNGDKRLGTEMNNFLNENWKEASQEVYKGISTTIGTIITYVLQKYFKNIPYDQIIKQ